MYIPFGTLNTEDSINTHSEFNYTASLYFSNIISVDNSKTFYFIEAFQKNAIIY
jgi:hypothetical protein